MSNNLTISQKGIDLIKRWEGLRTYSYLCPAGVWTIGYGHTKDVKPGQTCTPYQAEQLLKQDIKLFESGVKTLVKVKLTQNQYDALVSFTFNLGIGALMKSTLLKKLNAGDYWGAAEQFSRWVYAGKQKLPGLVTRRNEEKRLFLS